MKKHANIPVFIPHLGCPNQCVFCNQRTITGNENFDPESVRDIIDSALSTIGEDTDVEIAFFGGSFTGIDKELMIRLLEIAHSYIKSGKVSSIRCSTRPDYINPQVLELLKKYGVKCVELGLQSISEKVLSDTKRGHSYEDSVNACKMIIDSGFSLVGQMMIGLPGADIESEVKTAEFIIKSGATAARIYPTVVFKDTELYYMAECGIYKPLSLEDAVIRSARVLEMFYNAGVDVIRIGLCASENLASPDTYFGGPNHPALGELVENEFYFTKIYRLISDSPSNIQKVTVKVAKGALSKAIGQKRKNMLRLKSLFPSIDLSFTECADIRRYEVMAEIEERKDKCI